MVPSIIPLNVEELTCLPLVNWDSSLKTENKTIYMKSSRTKMDSSPLFCASDAIKLSTGKPKESASAISRCRSLPSLSSKPTTDSNLRQTNTGKRRNSLPGNLKSGSNHSINFPVSCASKVKLKDLQPAKKPEKRLVRKRKDWHQKDFVKPLRSSPRHRKVQRKEENDLTKPGCDSSNKNNTSAYLTETSQMSLENSDNEESEFPVDNQTTIPKTKSSESRKKRKLKTKSHSKNGSHKKVANSQIIEQNNNDITCNPVSEHSAKRRKSPNRTGKQSLTVTDFSEEKNNQNNGNICKPESEHCAKRKKVQEKQSNTVSVSIQSQSSCLAKSSKSKRSTKRKIKKKRTGVSPNNLDSLNKLPELNYPKRLQLPSGESSEHSVSGSITRKPKTLNPAQIPDLTKESEIPDISSSRTCKLSSAESRSKRKRDNSEERTRDQSENGKKDENDSDSSDIPGQRPGFSHFDPNLNEESCVESDDDLPDLSSPSSDVLHSPKVNDYVWVKRKKYPFWPSKIVAVEKNKVKVTFYGYKENGCTVPYKNEVVVPFSSSKASEFIENGRKHKLKDKFNKGYKEITNEMMDKYIQNYSPCIDKPTASEDQFADSFYSNGSDESKVDPINTTPVKSKKSRPRSHSLDVKITPKMKEKYDQQMERLKERNIKLIEFIKSNQMKEYLEGIYRGRIESELHDKYTTCEHGKRKMEKISLDFLEDSQVDDIVGVLVNWYEKLTGNALNNIPYVINVWLHEAIVYSLVKVRKYSKKKAWQIYAAPRKATRIAEIIQHKQMITPTDTLETRLARLRLPPKMTQVKKGLQY